MIYNVILTKEAYTDLSSLGKNTALWLQKILEGKLSANPLEYGKPLRGNLTGYFKLKISIYRVVYTVYRGKLTVVVIAIGKRKDGKIYEEALKRTRK